jgi:hypothetical protein
MYHGQEVATSERFKVDIYPEGKAHTITLSLRITNISEIDFGEYECFASNKLGRDREAMVLYGRGLYVTEKLWSVTYCTCT